MQATTAVVNAASARSSSSLLLLLLAATAAVAAVPKQGMPESVVPEGEQQQLVAMLGAMLGVPAMEAQEVQEAADKPDYARYGDDLYDTSSLRLLHIVFRHGQRTPADTYPNDPHAKHDFAPVGWGQLTLAGKRDQFEQGRWLRRRYGRFLGELYHPDVVAVQSTDVDRTLMSATLTMAGLWPPAPAQRWNADLDWQPVPVRSQPLDQDDLLLVRVPCGRYGELLEETMRQPGVQALLRDNEPLLRWLSHKTGSKVATPDDVQSLYSTLKAEAEFNLTLPDWTKEVYPERLKRLTALSFEINAMTREMQRIKGGPLLGAVLEHCEARARGTLKPAERRLFAYAGHDSTVSNLLIALGAWDTQIPGYGILVLVELHQDPATEQYGLKLFLRNSTAVPPYPLEIRGCGHFCPLQRVIELTRDVVPASLREACEARDPNYTPPPPSGP